MCLKCAIAKHNASVWDNAVKLQLRLFNVKTIAALLFVIEKVSLKASHYFAVFQPDGSVEEGCQQLEG